MRENIFDKLIISDTSCLIAFSNIGRLDILRDICHSVIITPEVANEYKDPLPDWVHIQKVHDSAKTKSLVSFLGLGESSAIALALESENALVILDDKKGRKYAESIGIDIIGILGILHYAYELKLFSDIEDMVKNLITIDFRLPANAAEIIKGQ